MKALVTGGAGFIGSNIEKEIIGYRNTDALIRGEYFLSAEVQAAYDTYCACFG